MLIVMTMAMLIMIIMPYEMDINMPFAPQLLAAWQPTDNLRSLSQVWIAAPL